MLEILLVYYNLFQYVFMFKFMTIDYFLSPRKIQQIQYTFFDFYFFIYSSGYIFFEVGLPTATLAIAFALATTTTTLGGSGHVFEFFGELCVLGTVQDAKEIAGMLRITILKERD